MRKGFTIFLTITYSMIFAVMPVCAKEYTVEKGDCLWKLAEDYLEAGYRWEEIYEANRELIGENPSYLLPGQVLFIDIEEETLAVEEEEIILQVEEAGRQTQEPMKDAEGYYLIGMPEELLWFAQWVEKGNTDACARLTKDIEYNDKWDPIGNFTDSGSSAQQAYAGIFDGQGHTIFGLCIESGKTGIGFFSMITEEGCVRDLNLDSLYALGGKAHHFNEYARVGGISGVGGIILNCTVSGRIESESNYFTGGICGKGYYIENCVNNCEIISHSDVGGITGCLEGEVKFCTNNGRIEVKKGGFNGGIAGRMKYGSQITDCTNNGEVKSTESDFIAGICGANGGLIKNCCNYGAITYYSEGYSDQYSLNYSNEKVLVEKGICGISGKITYENSVLRNTKIKDCKNYGTITKQ